MDDWQDSYAPYFSSKEMKCRGVSCDCGGALLPKHSFMEKLVFARIEADVPFVVTSGARCASHNASSSVRGARDSAHVLQVAVDLYVPEAEHVARILRAALEVGMTGIGIAMNNRQKMIHLDSRPGPLRIWTYPLTIK